MCACACVSSDTAGQPFPCVHQGCTKSFVQLHQMKKHSKTPHGPGGEVAGGGGGGGGGGRGRKRAVAAEDSDAEYEELVLVAAEAAKKHRGRPPALTRVTAPSMEEQQADEELARTMAPAARARSRTPHGAEEAEAASVLVAVELEAATERPLTPLDHDHRSSMVMSPTSLLLSNTTWQAAGRASLWSPLPGAFGSDGHGGTPLPPLEDLQNSPSATPVRNFMPSSGAFMPIPEGSGSVSSLSSQQEPSYPAPSLVTPSRPIPSPMPVSSVYKI
jgi:hypothetical protein